MPRSHALLWTIAAACALAACGGEEPAVPPSARTLAWRADVRPVLEEYCVGCHKGAEPEAALDLEAHARSEEPPTLAALRADHGRFERMAAHVADGFMPPAPEAQPGTAAREAFAHWFTEALGTAWRSAPPDPGRVTMRRLNRYEYRNTVRDLLGVDFDTEETFPADDVGYGFDHIGDVLSMSPLLFEKYLGAAEVIADRAISVIHPEDLVPRRFSAVDMAFGSDAVRPAGDGVAIVSNAEVRQRIRFPREGTYYLRVEAFARQAGPDVARMALKVGGRLKALFEVAATSPETYAVKVDVERGRHTVSVGFTNDYYRPNDPDPKQRDRNLHVNWLEVEGPGGDAPGDRARLHPHVFSCDPVVGDEGPCLETTLRSLLARAFRRPPTQAEVVRYVALALEAREAGESFDGAVQVALEAMLVSPQFLFRMELDERADPGAPMQALDDHALASRLSYFLWSSMPDDELRALADAGTLRAGLHGQVRRMLADPKARALVENFAVQWLELRRLDTAAPDARRFKHFTERLRADMREETERFVAVIVEEDRSILDLLDAPFTFLNERLAKHYGIAGVKGSEFRRVALPGSARGGLLGHGSILTLTSYPTRTSVVQRGKWLMQEILGTPPPPPPPGVGTLEEQADELLQLSLRERLAVHRENPDCAVCHDRMDNLGYGLENFDAVGAWRTRDGTHPIESAGTLPDGRAFDGPKELKRILREDPNVPRCFAEKLLTYALGRGLEPYDRPAVLRIVREAKARGHRFSSFVHAIVATDAFTMRRASGGTQ